MMKLRVVVTGASGFLGTRVVRALAERPDVKVLGIARREAPGASRVIDYSESPGGDVLVHLAEDNDRARVAQAGAAYEEQMRSTLLALLAKGYQRVVYASSAVLYGDKDTHAHVVDDPVHVNDVYTRVKRQSELAVLTSATGVVIRLANLYGRSMADDNVMSTILRQIPASGPLQVRDLAPVRDFLWVEDAAQGVAALASLEEERPGGVFNLGTRTGTSIGKLAHMALEVAGQPDRAVTAVCESTRPSSLILDYSDTASACGWQPRISLREGLARLLDPRHTSN